MLQPLALRACGASTQCYLQGKPCLTDKNPYSDPSVPKCAILHKRRRATRLRAGAGAGVRARVGVGGSRRAYAPAATVPGFACGPGAVPVRGGGAVFYLL